VGSRHLCGANRAAQMRKPALHRYNEVLISLLGSLLRFNHPDLYAFLRRLVMSRASAKNGLKNKAMVRKISYHF
jgi:hypothetical protein